MPLDELRQPGQLTLRDRLVAFGLLLILNTAALVVNLFAVPLPISLTALAVLAAVDGFVIWYLWRRRTRMDKVGGQGK